MRIILKYQWKPSSDTSLFSPSIWSLFLSQICSYLWRRCIICHWPLVLWSSRTLIYFESNNRHNFCPKIKEDKVCFKHELNSKECNNICTVKKLRTTYWYVLTCYHLANIIWMQQQNLTYRSLGKNISNVCCLLLGLLVCWTSCPAL